MNPLKILDGYNTYIAAAGLVLTAIAGFLNGTTTEIETVVIIMNGLGFAGAKNAIDKGARLTR